MRNRHTDTDTIETPVPSLVELIPLSHLVIEGLADSIDQLAASIDEVHVDDIGRGCTTRDTARRLFAERAEAEARAREVQRRQQQQVQEKHARFLASVRAGVPAPEGMEDLSALEVMMAGAHDERLEAAGRRFDELASGGITYHPLNGE